MAGQACVRGERHREAEHVRVPQAPASTPRCMPLLILQTGDSSSEQVVRGTNKTRNPTQREIPESLNLVNEQNEDTSIVNCEGSFTLNLAMKRLRCNSASRIHSSLKL